MTDIEGNPLLTTRNYSNGNATINNPYSDQQQERIKRTLADKIISTVTRLVYISGSTFILQHFFQFYPTIIRSPFISHEWFKIGLASNIALLGIKAYVEIYEGQVRKVKVNYTTFPQCTHAALGLLCISGFAYHVALWSQYHWNTIIVLDVLLFSGIIIPFLLLLPTYLQNIISFILLVFFLQEYQ